jgi:hypothetical protein
VPQVDGMDALGPGIDNRVSSQWRQFTLTFLGFFAGGLTIVYLFVLLVDPYGINPLSLPIARAIVSISQRYVYPQLVRSGRFDSFVVGTSTSRLLDPHILNAAFDARFVNLGMDSMTAWEQSRMIDYFVRKAGEPKVMLIGLDGVWCDPDAVGHRITFRGFPDWLYDDNSLKAFAYLLNNGTIEIAGRLVGYNLGLYRERVRNDGFEVFVPPDDTYDLERARRHIWAGGKRPHPLSDGVHDPVPQSLSFPALTWLDEALARMPRARKILAYMPVHVAAQPPAGSASQQAETECKRRIASIAVERHAVVIDWRIASPLTENDTNYWDGLHYRLPVAELVARETADAALTGAVSPNGLYQITVR